MDLYGHFGPLRGHNPIFFKTLFYSKIISLSIQMGSGRIIFYFNPLNGHYLYPPFFRNTKAKEEKMDLWPLTWAKSTRAQTGNIYQNLSKYISYQKIKVKNPPQGEGAKPLWDHGLLSMVILHKQCNRLAFLDKILHLSDTDV